MKILVIANPVAGSGTMRRHAHGLLSALQKRAGHVRLCWTEAPGHAANLVAHLAPEYDVVLVMGGDGTLNEAACGLIEAEADVPLAVAPYGSGNDYARLLGMPTRSAAIAEVVLRRNVRRMDLGEAEWSTADGEGKRIFVNAVGCGVDALIARIVSTPGSVRGRRRYLAAIRRAVAEWNNPLATIRLDESSWHNEMLLCTAAIGRTSGGGVRLTPRAQPDDGLFDVCLVPRLSAGRILQLLPAAVIGRHLGAREVLYETSSYLSVDAPTGIPVHLDGEVLPQNVHGLWVRILPGRLRVVVPHAG